ncbi:hypothetical protein [Luteipulveratus halotolerans]|uniref:Uncharacterized protein n=1 Tax=Luteipulveratus halotolerans TaxID=1631356 RepID=A0A0L6CLK5_9MICO|nr:hypothetical protein [Luteipulveratus halotolerans]KNX38413.1 hypothetical protein VV01_16700 [Luteipulveratus halotolerans]
MADTTTSIPITMPVEIWWGIDGSMDNKAHAECAGTPSEASMKECADLGRTASAIVGRALDDQP